jgi:hypothetical protein
VLKISREYIIFLTIVIGFFFFVFKNCTVDHKSRENLKSTNKICDEVFIETYCVFGQGGFGGDLNADWLTDQKNFRMYIGTEDEAHGPYWWYQCFGDSVRVNHGKNKADSKTYKLSDLRKLNNFNDD